jgi:SPOR domain
MIGDGFLPSPEGPTLLLTASDDRHDDDILTAETGDAYGAHDYYDDLPSPRWRDRLVIVIAVIALAGLGAVGTFAYRAVFAGAVLPALPPIIKAENAPNENVPNYGDDRPSHLSQTSIASAGSSEEFVSRWSADIQEPPKTAPISPNQSASPPSALGSGAVATIAPALAAPPPANAPLALTATSLPPPVPAPSSSTPKKVQTVIGRSEGSGQTDTSAATAKSPEAKPSAAAAPPAGNQPLRLAADAATTAPEAKQTAAVALPVGRPLSLAPDAHGHAAASPPPSRSRMPAGTGTAAEASSGGGYAVAVASERSAADAEAVFRSLQAKFPDQLGGREPIVHRTDLGPEGIYYRASIGPFVSMKAAARVCSSLKAAGESCLVEKN